MEFRAGIIGCGQIGKKYALAFRKMGVEVGGVADIDDKKREEVASIAGAQPFRDYRRMLDQAKPNVVGICTPIGLHYEPVMEAAKRGIHIFCEKPLASTLERGIEMVRFCRDQGVKLGLGFNKRYEKITVLAKEIVDSGSIGEAWYFFVSYFQPEPPIPWYREWGATLDTLVHQIDYANWILQAEPTRVTVEKQYFLDNPGEDKSFINLDYGDKKAIICGGYFREYPPIAGSHDTCFQIVGKKGYLLGKRPDILFLCNSAEAQQLNQRMQNSFVSKQDSFLLELSDFLQAVKHNTPLPVSGEDGLRAQIVIEGIKKSQVEKKFVDLKTVTEYLSDNSGEP